MEIPWPESLDPLAAALSAEAWLQLANLFLWAVSIGVAYCQFRRYRHQLQSEYVKARRERAIGLSVSNRPHLQETRRRLALAFTPKTLRSSEPIPLETFQALIEQDPSLEVDLDTALAYWENLSLTVAFDATDEEMLFEMVGSTLVRTCRRFRLYIDWVRERHAPRFCDYFLALAGRWEKRLAAAGRRPPRFHADA